MDSRLRGNDVLVVIPNSTKIVRTAVRLRGFIRHNARHGIRTQQVADYVGVSRSSLETYFRQELGCSVHDAILRFKLSTAMDGLDRGERSIPDVALACGFNTTQYMYMVFKRELGCTPLAYRDHAFNENALTSDVHQLLSSEIGQASAQRCM